MCDGHRLHGTKSMTNEHRTDQRKLLYHGACVCNKCIHLIIDAVRCITVPALVKYCDTILIEDMLRQ